MRQGKRKMCAVWLAVNLLIITIVYPVHTLKATGTVNQIGGNHLISSNGTYELTGTDNDPREIEIADGVTNVVLRQQNSEAALNARIMTFNTTTLTLTIEGLRISSPLHSPLELLGTGEVRLILDGENVLTTAAGVAAVAVEGSAKLVISGEGSLYAHGGSGGAGIGSSGYTAAGTIVINGGTIRAFGGGAAAFSGGAGIGSGYLGVSGHIEINGGVIEATGASGGAGIGGGATRSGGTITINGGVITALGSRGSAGIGGGTGTENGGTIAIHGGEISATGGYFEFNDDVLSGAGIGGSYGGTGGTITITGGHVVAAGGAGIAAGIGGGAINSSTIGYTTQPATVELQGGVVVSAPGYNGEAFSGTVTGENGGAPLLLTLTFEQPSGGHSSPVAGAAICLKGNTVHTDANGKLYLYVPEGAYTLASLELTGADGYRALSLTPETIQVAEHQPNEGVVAWSNRYEAVWHLAGGAMAHDTVTEAVYGTAIDAPSPSPLRAGYTFAGWFTDEDEAYAQEVQFPFALLRNTHLYAFWTANLLNLPVASLDGGTYGTPYEDTIPAASNGTGSYTYAVTDGSLPDGFSLSGLTIEGTAERAGLYEFEVTATDTLSGSTAARSYTIDIVPAVPAADSSVQAGLLQRGKALQQATLTGSFRHATSGEAVAGALAWADPAFVPSQRSTNQEWVFTPNDQHNYAEVRGTVQVSWPSGSVSEEGAVPTTQAPTPERSANYVLRLDEQLSSSPGIEIRRVILTDEAIEAALPLLLEAGRLVIEGRPWADAGGAEQERQLVIGSAALERLAKAKLTLVYQAGDATYVWHAAELLRLLPTSGGPDQAAWLRLSIGKLSAGASADIRQHALTSGYEIVGEPMRYSWGREADATREGIEKEQPAATNIPLQWRVGNEGDSGPLWGMRMTDEGDWSPVPAVAQDGHMLWFGGGSGVYIPTEQLEQSFSDIQTHWAKEEVEWLSNRDVVKGKGEGRFDPEGTVTRAEFAQMIVRALGLWQPVAGHSAFRDVAAGQWYSAAVNQSARYGLIDEQSSFRPADAITRSDVFSAVGRSVLWFEADTAPTADIADDLEAYADAAQVPDADRASLLILLQLGIVQGSNGKLHPDRELTRAEAAALLVRLLKQGGFGQPNHQ